MPLLDARLLQELAIAVAHQGKTGLHEPDCPAAQVMGFPGMIGKAFLAEQGLGDDPIGGTVMAGIQRPQALQQSLSSLVREVLGSGVYGARHKASPEQIGGMGNDGKLTIEREDDRISSIWIRRFIKPQSMLNPGNP